MSVYVRARERVQVAIAIATATSDGMQLSPNDIDSKHCNIL